MVNFLFHGKSNVCSFKHSILVLTVVNAFFHGAINNIYHDRKQALIIVKYSTKSIRFFRDICCKT